MWREHKNGFAFAARPKTRRTTKPNKKSAKRSVYFTGPSKKRTNLIEETSHSMCCAFKLYIFGISISFFLFFGFRFVFFFAPLFF